MLNIINARISITTIVEPTGVSARIEINIPKLAHITDISDEHRITDLNVLNISSDTATVRESVRSMGNPDSIKNVINDGMINCFSYISLNNDNSKVDFEVIVHSALIDGGSSGGALLDSNNEIIGITFAGVFDKKDNFIVGYAIPCEKIMEFLNK